MAWKRTRETAAEVSRIPAVPSTDSSNCPLVKSQWRRDAMHHHRVGYCERYCVARLACAALLADNVDLWTSCTISPSITRVSPHAHCRRIFQPPPMASCATSLIFSLSCNVTIITCYEIVRLVSNAELNVYRWWSLNTNRFVDVFLVSIVKWWTGTRLAVLILRMLRYPLYWGMKQERTWNNFAIISWVYKHLL